MKNQLNWMILSKNWWICAKYDELRPWKPKPGQKQYKHEAIDVIAENNTPVGAPEDGTLFIFQITRNSTDIKPELNWPIKTAYKMFGRKNVPFLFRHKCDDGPDHGYGCCLALYGKSGTTHFIAHMEEWQMGYIAAELGVELTMEKYGSFSVISNLHEPVEVEAGDKIGSVGNRGFSTDPHVHFETWEKGKRTNPEKLFPREIAQERSGSYAS